MKATLDWTWWPQFNRFAITRVREGLLDEERTVIELTPRQARAFAKFVTRNDLGAARFP